MFELKFAVKRAWSHMTKWENSCKAEKKNKKRQFALKLTQTICWASAS